MGANTASVPSSPISPILLLWFPVFPKAKNHNSEGISKWTRLERMWQGNWLWYELEDFKVLKSGKDTMLNMWGQKKSTLKRTKAPMP